MVIGRSTPKISGLSAAESFENTEGKGVQGVVDGHTVLAYRNAMLAALSRCLMGTFEARSRSRRPRARRQARSAGTGRRVPWPSPSIRAPVVGMYSQVSLKSGAVAGPAPSGRAYPFR